MAIPLPRQFTQQFATVGGWNGRRIPSHKTLSPNSQPGDDSGMIRANTRVSQRLCHAPSSLRFPSARPVGVQPEGLVLVALGGQHFCMQSHGTLEPFIAMRFQAAASAGISHPHHLAALVVKRLIQEPCADAEASSTHFAKWGHFAKAFGTTDPLPDQRCCPWFPV